jgi:hypothetical protein
MDFASTWGVNDPVANAVINGLMVNAIWGGNYQGAANVVGTMILIDALSKAFQGNPCEDMEERRREIVKLIEERKYKEASRQMREYEKELDELLGKLSPGTAPAELEEIRSRMHKAENRIALNVPRAAIDHLENAGQLIAQFCERVQPRKRD